MSTKMKRDGLDTLAATQEPFVVGDRVIVAGAGREWSARVTSRPLPNARESIHPQYDDTVIFVRFDETSISMAVGVRQVSKVRR